MKNNGNVLNLNKLPEDDGTSVLAVYIGTSEIAEQLFAVARSHCSPGQPPRQSRTSPFPQIRNLNLRLWQPMAELQL